MKLKIVSLFLCVSWCIFFAVLCRESTDDLSVNETALDEAYLLKYEARNNNKKICSKASHGHELGKDDLEDNSLLFKYIMYKMVHSEFFLGFIASLSMIILSEIGDRTFFIAAILAMRHSRLEVLAGALGANVLMTILSGLLGYATAIIPHVLTHFISALLFLVFGLKMIQEGWYMSPDEAQEEYEEVQAEIKKKEDELLTSSQDKGIVRGRSRNFLYTLFSAVFLESFVLTFLAEWGDRSQIATIILAAREDVWGVIIGGFIGHTLCTGLAVVGGRIVAAKISARTVTILGGIMFILFAVVAFAVGPD